MRKKYETPKVTTYSGDEIIKILNAWASTELFTEPVSNVTIND